MLAVQARSTGRRVVRLGLAHGWLALIGSAPIRCLFTWILRWSGRVPHVGILELIGSSIKVRLASHHLPLRRWIILSILRMPSVLEVILHLFWYMMVFKWF